MSALVEGCRSYPLERARVEACFGRTVLETPEGAITIGEVVERLLAGGVQVFVTGGAPRDWLCGIPAKDVDLAIDCALPQAHALLRAAWPGVDPVLIKSEDFGMMRWGRSHEESLDINILRSPEALEGRPISQTRFQPSGSVYANSQMADFSINTFYYDCANQRLLEPQEGSLEDLRHQRLRLVSHPRKLAVDFRTSLRVAQFVCRGYTPEETTRGHLERLADRDVQGMETMLAGWVQQHLPPNPEPRERFRTFLTPYLREPRSRELLARALEDGASSQPWAPPGPGGQSGNTSRAS